MMMELESMAVEMPAVEGHPNRVGFCGVLTVVDAASQRAPGGARGHRVVLTRGAAEAALPSLLGMALDYAPSYDRHDQRRKVGVITSAEIVGRNLEVGGYLYGKDFPDVVEEIGKSGGRAAEEGRSAARGTPDRVAAGLCSSFVRGTGKGETHRFGARIAAMEGVAETGKETRPTAGTRLRASLAAAVESLREQMSGMRGSRKSAPVPTVLRAEMAGGGAGGLGMSFEVTDVLLADTRSRVWILTHVTFTGAAILRKDRAAYEETWIELA